VLPYVLMITCKHKGRAGFGASVDGLVKLTSRAGFPFLKQL
jgi:hypothetical protein